MKDIDFDELDRAVNSLMATTPATELKSSPSPSAPDVAVNSPVEGPVAAQAVPTPPSSVEPATVVEPPSDTVPVTIRPVVAPPAARRGGRFMDMVSKPNDAKPRTNTLPVTTPSREGLTITPRADEPAVVTVSPASAPPVPAEPIEAPKNESASSFGTMPDPIDMIDLSSPSEPPVAELPPESTDITQEAPVASPPLGSLESPFITDAKVEKRPLNSDSSDIAATETLHEEDSDDSFTPYETGSFKAEEKGADEPPAVPSVAELDSNLVAIEANEKTDFVQAIDTADAASEVAAPSTPLGASSIAQQYTTQASSGDKSHAAIYDTSQYPQPVAHPAKSKSGWLWVLWVALLLGVGAGGAILLYNLGIIP